MSDTDAIVDRLVYLVRLYRGTEDLDALREEFRCVLSAPSSSTAPRAVHTCDPRDFRCAACRAEAAPAPRQPSDPARDPLCSCRWSPVSPAGRVMCDHCRRAADTNGGTET